MEHNHNHHHHEKSASLKNLIFAMVINGGIVAFEMVFGLLIQSMALISDAVHNLSDIAAMIFSYWAEKVSHRPPNAQKTYGYHKVEFIAAFVNSIVLSVAIAFILWEAVGRLTSPPAIPGKEMLWVAVIAFVGNGAATILMQKISTQNFNMRTVWLHSLQDALFSLGVIVGALLIMLFGWQTVNSLLDAVPPGIDFIQVRDDLLAIDAVVEVHDLHVWQTGANQKLLSAHLRMTETASESHSETIIRTAQEMLLHKYGINHTTLQILPFSAGEMEHCSHCN